MEKNSHMNNINNNNNYERSDNYNDNNNNTGELKSNFNILQFAKNMISISQKKAEEKNLIILGDKEAGKTTIFNNLIGISLQKESYATTSGLNFNYVRHQMGQKKTILNVYEIGGGVNNLDLIKTLLNNNNYKNTFFIIVLDFAKPANAVHSLKSYLASLNAYFRENITQDNILELIEAKKNMFMDRNTNNDYKRLNFFPAEVIVVGNKYDFLEQRDM